MKNFVSAIKRYKIEWARREKIDTQVLSEWEATVTSTVKDRIDNLEININNLSDNTGNKYLHLKHLNKLHGEYVLFPADKASKNVQVVCKKYYLDVVIKELVDKSKSGPSTYVKCHDSIDKIVKEHLQYMNSNNKIPKEMIGLLTFYWLPKMHKTPVGSRFIHVVASSSCTMKPLSK